MATISDCRAIYGLSAVGTPSSTGVDGTVTLGVTQTTQRLTSANVAYSLRAIFAGIGDTLALALNTGSTSGSTAWVAGRAQVETATVTAAGGITGSGNATVTVTAAGMTGSPKAISVALTTATHTTDTLIATAIAAALNADTDYSAMFTATSSGADVITTRNATGSFTVPTGTLSLYAANDGTLNVAIANGTCTGITTAATSTNTTTGIITDGVKIYDGDGNDFEGVTISAASITALLLVAGDSESVGDEYMDITGGVSEIMQIQKGGINLKAETPPHYMVETSYSFGANGMFDLTIHVIGEA